MKQMPIFPILLACLGAALLGCSPIFVRMSDLGPITTAFYRMVFALPFLLIWMTYEKKKSPQITSAEDFWIFILAGVIFALDLALWNWSIDHTTIVNSTLFNNTAVFFVPLLAWGFFKVKPTKRMAGSVLAATVGCILLFHESLSVSLHNVLGDIIALTSGFMVAIYVIAIKKVRSRTPAGRLMFWTCIPTFVVLGGITFLFNESFYPLTVNDVISVFGQAILVHVLGQGFLAYAMGFIPASYGAIILLLAPVTAAILGTVIYGENLNALQIVGVVIILLSIVFVKEGKKPYQMGSQ